MSLRKKIVLYFSVSVISITGFFLFIIYLIFSEYREEEFQQRQKEKIETTLKLLTEIRGMNKDLAQAIDDNTIHDFYDEKMLIFNIHKEKIFSSIDDLPISISTKILDELSPENKWIETKEEKYDVVGIFIELDGSAFYGISKAYDAFGYSKLQFLQWILLGSFFVISLIVLSVSFYLATIITKPISEIAVRLKNFHLGKVIKDSLLTPTDKEDKNEITVLAEQFNAMMQKINEAFAYQKHVVNHISHELKTPIAILVSNFEKIETELDHDKKNQLIRKQKENTKNLSDIINLLLEIAKIETDKDLDKKIVRIDDILFDTINEFTTIHPNFCFNVHFSDDNYEEADLLLESNERLLKLGFRNILNNCVNYSVSESADIFVSSKNKELIIVITNDGKTISVKEQNYMFQRFFRGENSLGIQGFGLGLVFIKNIIELHNGSISYMINENGLNEFTLVFVRH
jgi:two-component system sensor histidine kinase ArlS